MPSRVGTPIDQPVTSTTVDPTAADKAEITKLVLDWERLVRQFKGQHVNWDKEVAAQHVGGAVLEDAADWIPKWQFAGKRSMPPIGSRTRVTLENVEVAGATAVVRTCEVNDMVTEAADGSVLDDSVNMHSATWVAKRTSAGWRLWDVESSKTKPGVSKCDA